MIPVEALNQHLMVLGKTGAGKSYSTRSMVEQLLELGRRVCILDYTGVWWGLRTSADGMGKGFPVVLVGGEHGDLPLTEDGAEPLARFIAEGDAPVVVDLDGLTVGAQQRFVTRFLEELYRLNSRALHLIIEEIDEFAPQTGAPGAERMIGATCRIFQRGRKKGFRAIAITQRPANVHKRVLAQCAAMVAMKLVAPQDRKAVSDWVRGHGDADEGRNVVDTLPKLARGEAWVWVPDEDVLERQRFPAIRTFDSMAAPIDGERPAYVTTAWADVDLEPLRASLSAVTNVKGKSYEAAPSPDVQSMISAARQEGYEKGWSDGHKAGWDMHARGAMKVMDECRLAFESDLDKTPLEAPPERTNMYIDVHSAPRPGSAKTDANYARIIPKPRAKPNGHAGGLPSGASGLLEAMCRFAPTRMAWTQIATLAGRKARGGHFNTSKKAILEQGYAVEHGELVEPADLAFSLTGQVRKKAATGAARAELWLEALPGPADKMLRHLLDVGPLDPPALAAGLNMQPRGGHWNTGLSTLRRNGLIVEEGGQIRPTV